jgi:hypothetical protein
MFNAVGVHADSPTFKTSTHILKHLERISKSMSTTGETEGRRNKTIQKKK